MGISTSFVVRGSSEGVVVGSTRPVTAPSLLCRPSRRGGLTYLGHRKPARNPSGGPEVPKTNGTNGPRHRDHSLDRTSVLLTSFSPLPSSSAVTRFGTRRPSEFHLVHFLHRPTEHPFILSFRMDECIWVHV